jgi:Domain of unknown function (DUF1833)
VPIYRSAKRGVQYSEAIAAAYAAAPEDEVVLDTLEFRHVTFIEPGTGEPFAIRVVNDHQPLLATLEDDAPLDPGAEVTFKAAYFAMVRPPETESGSTPEISITVDNVARELMQYLEAAKETRQPVYVTWRPYLASDTSAPHMLPVLTLTMRSVSCSMSSVTGRAGFGDLTNRRFPSLEYVSKNFPGLSAR